LCGKVLSFAGFGEFILGFGLVRALMKIYTNLHHRRQIRPVGYR